MTDDEKLMQQALEALSAMLTHMGMDEDDWNKPTFNQCRKAEAALRERLAQPEQEQEPVTCVCGAVWEGEMMVHPPRKREWVGLTADEIWKCNKAKSGSFVEFHICYEHQNVEDFAEAIEAKLREKNHG